MKYCVLFLFGFAQQIFTAQQSVNTTVTAQITTVGVSFSSSSTTFAGTSEGIPSSAILSTIINLNSVTGNKFFADNVNNTPGYVFLYSYAEFKKKLNGIKASNDERLELDYIIKNLDDAFSKKDTMVATIYREINTANKFRELFQKFKEESFNNHNFLIINTKNGQVESKLIHKQCASYFINSKKEFKQDEYFLPDEKTSIYGRATYTVTNY